MSTEVAHNMSSTTLIVSNLPSIADMDFLQTLFDGHVKHTVWVGSGGGGSQRFVLVSFTDEDYARRVLESQRAFRKAKEDGTLDALQAGRTNRRKRSRQSALDEGGSGSTTAASSSSTTFTTPLEVQPFFGSVLCKGTVCDRVLYIDESPIAVDAFLDANHGTERRGVGSKGVRESSRTGLPTARKDTRGAERPRHSQHQSLESPAGRDEPSLPSVVAESTPVAPAKVKGRSTAIPSFSEAKKQSTRLDVDDGSDRDEVGAASASPQCSGGQLRSVVHDSLASNVVTAAPARTVAVGRQQARPGNESSRESVADAVVERKRNPAAAHPPPPVASQPEVTKKAPASAAAPVLFPRTSKDQCKFCGSEQHLSRHCPNK